MSVELTVGKKQSDPDNADGLVFLFEYLGHTLDRIARALDPVGMRFTSSVRKVQSRG